MKPDGKGHTSKLFIAIGDNRYEQVCFAAMHLGMMAWSAHCMEKLLEKFPESKRVKRINGLYHEAMAEYGEALAVYKEILKEAPESTFARRRIIAMYVVIHCECHPPTRFLLRAACALRGVGASVYQRHFPVLTANFGHDVLDAENDERADSNRKFKSNLIYHLSTPGSAARGRRRTQ